MALPPLHLSKKELTMSYLSVLSSLIARDDDIFQLAVDGKSRKFVIFNLIILGVLFGLSNFFGTIPTTPDLPVDGKFAIITPLAFCIAGFFNMFGALIGLILIYWSASRAFGGRGGFVLIFDLLGLTLVPFWFIAPLLNYVINFNISQTGTVIFLGIIGVTGGWSFIITRDSLIKGQGLSRNKATIAVYGIWIFSVSSVYVFLP